MDPAGLASRVLEALTAAIGPEQLPTRRYTYVGTPVFDRAAGEAFTVSTTRVYAGDPAVAQSPFAAAAVSGLDLNFWSVELAASIARCSNAELEPASDAKELDALGQLAMTDGIRLLQGALDALDAGTLAPHNRVVIGPVIWTEPEGGMVATTVTLNVSLGD